MLLRTAKSCGPDAPTLASSLRRHVGPTGLRHAISADDGGKQARSPGRARRKPLKPLRRECRVFRGTCGDYTRVLPTHCTRGCGCNGHPAFPTPSLGREINAQLGRIAPRGQTRVCCLTIESSFVVPAKAGTHTPCHLVAARSQRPSITTNAGGYGSLLSQGRRAERCLQRPVGSQ